MIVAGSSSSTTTSGIGLTASGAPIPLGGTSNHFRVQALKDSGADVLVSYLPVGSQEATEFYATAALEAIGSRTHAEVTRDVVATLGTHGRGYTIMLLGAVAVAAPALWPAVGRVTAGWEVALQGEEEEAAAAAAKEEEEESEEEY